VHRLSVKALMALNLVGCLALGMAAAPAIGLVTASGSFTLDQSRVQSNATLFDGNRIDAGNTTPQLHWNNGGKMLLAAGSSGIVYKDRLVLEQGENQGNYPVEARGLRVVPDPNGQARVSLRDGDTIQVAALSGVVRVATSAGVLVANLTPGRAASFALDQAGASAPSTLTGCLESSGGKYVVTDEASTVRFILEGTGFEKYAGSRVEVSGTVVPGSGVENTVKVSSVQELSKKCGRSGAGAVPGKAAAGAKAAGMSATTKAVIAGVVVAGAATGGTIAAVNGEDDTVSGSQR
jgi:hypothetical protein